MDMDFEAKLLLDFYTIKKKVKQIWADARSAVFGGKASNRSRLRKKILDSLRSIVDILGCRYNFSLIFLLHRKLARATPESSSNRGSLDNISNC